MSDAAELRDLLAAVALGAATPDELERVERAAASDPAVAEELSSLRAVASSLALDVPQFDPPPSLRRDLLAKVRADAARAPAHGRLAWLRLWPAVAAVAGAAALALLGWNLTLQGGDPDPVTTIAVQGTPEAPGVRGEVSVLPGDEVAILRLSDLPPPPAGREYELWIIRNGGPVSGGFLPSEGPTLGTITVTDLDGATALAVTSEPPANTTAPTAPPVVEVPLPVRA